MNPADTQFLALGVPGLFLEAYAPADYIDLTLKVFQSEIAALLGASRPNVNIAFAALHQQGAICCDGRTLHCDADMPSKLAELRGLG